MEAQEINYRIENEDGTAQSHETGKEIILLVILLMHDEHTPDLKNSAFSTKLKFRYYREIAAELPSQGSFLHIWPTSGPEN